MGVFVTQLILFLCNFLTQPDYLFLVFAVFLNQWLKEGNLGLQFTLFIISLLKLPFVTLQCFPAFCNFFNALVDPIVELVDIVDQIFQLFLDGGDFSAEHIIVLE